MACSRISSVQLFHLMPKDWADQKRNQLRTDLHELTQGGHFFLVYYSPISEHYQAITSQSWSPVVQSKELSSVLHSATQPIAYDEQDWQWCQRECSSLDMVLKKHISRDDAKCLASNHHPSIETRRNIKLSKFSCVRGGHLPAQSATEQVQDMQSRQGRLDDAGSRGALKLK